MEPVRAMVGFSQHLDEAASRLFLHEAEAVPVVKGTRPVGLLTIRQVRQALALGLGDLSAGMLTTGGAPCVPPTATAPAIKRALRGTAPALLVRSTGGVILGVLSREHLAKVEPGSSHKQSMARRLLKGFGTSQSHLLRRVSVLARDQGVGLYLVGGVVRDLILGRRPVDLDLVVAGDGLLFARKMAKLLNAEITQHLAFGTSVITLDDGSRVDVASTRRETYRAAAALPVVEAGSIHDDLFRRDVTINSIAIRLDSPHYGELRDDLGGAADLDLRLLRVHHAASLIEDPTRAYRIARFAARFGARLAPETRNALKLARERRAFDALGGERLYREFSRIAHEHDPAAALGVSARLGLLLHLGPGLSWDGTTRSAVRRLVRKARTGSAVHEVSAAPLLILMLLARNATPAQRRVAASRLKLRGKEKLAFLSFAVPLRSILRKPFKTDERPSRVVRAYGAVSPDVLLLARSLSPPSGSRLIDRYLDRLRHVKPPIGGEALRKMGLRQGPAIGHVLERLRDARLDGRVTTREEERRLAFDLVRRHGRIR